MSMGAFTRGAARIVRWIVLSLAHGAILMAFSEAVFWAGPVTGLVNPGQLVPTLIAYSICGLPVLWLLSRPVEHRLAGIVLAGAIYGWSVEGAVEATLFGDLPLSVSWTALAWHMPVTVLFGWYALPRLATRWRGALVIALAGAVWGAWAAFWPNERLRVPADAFALFAFAVTGVAMLAHLVILRVGDGRGPPAGLAAGAAILVALAWATKLAALGPLAALAPALVGLAFLAHSFLPRGPDAHSALAARRVPFGPGAAARMLLFPAVAAAVYGAFAAAGAAPATNIVFYLVSVPLGFVLLLAALVRAVRGLNARPRQAG